VIRAWRRDQFARCGADTFDSRPAGVWDLLEEPRFIRGSIQLLAMFGTKPLQGMKAFVQFPGPAAANVIVFF